MKKRTREAFAPDITPLIDVVFLLLIFFMVSTVFKKDELALLLNLPKAASGESVESAKHITVEVSPDQIAVNGKTIELEGMDEVFSKVQNKSIPIDLRIDKTVQYDRIIKIFDKLKAHELNNLSLVTKE